MTNISQKTTLLETFIRSPFTKVCIVVYSLYFMFSPQVFAYQAEAPAPEASEVSIVGTQTLSDKEALFNERVGKIERYYGRYNLPLGDYASDFVTAADKYDIDWRLLAAIGFIESTGGKFACKTVSHSAFGWGSCRIAFDSYESSIDTISLHLAGDHSATEYYYKDKGIRGKLESYNPPSVVPDYADKVMREMRIIESM